MTALAWVLFGLALATVLDPAGRAWVARGWWATVEYVRSGAALDSDERAYLDRSEGYRPRPSLAPRSPPPGSSAIPRKPGYDPPPSEGPRPTNDYGEKRRPAPNPTKPSIRWM